MTGLGTPGADLAGQFNVDRDFLDGCRDVITIEISDEAVSPDPNVAGRFQCVEHLRGRIEKLVERAAVRQPDVDSEPRCKWALRADIGLGIENHDDRRAVVEMSIEVPPFIAAAFRADALAVFELGYFNRSDAKSVVIGRLVCQMHADILAAMHGILSWRSHGHQLMVSALPADDLNV